MSDSDSSLSQEADFMAESESDAGEEDIELETQVCNPNNSNISLCLDIKSAIRIRTAGFMSAFV